jgi:hypothetical protein
MDQIQTEFAGAAPAPAADVMHPDTVRWRVKATRETFAADIDEFRALHGKAEGERLFHATQTPIETLVVDGNLLTTAGATALWNALTQGSAGAFTNATAALGVGDSSTAESAGQTNLQAGANGYRQAMDATYPSVSGATVTAKVTVGTSNANFAWNEWGFFSSVGSGSPPTGGTMLNRKVASLGTKTSAASWAFTITITLS